MINCFKVLKTAVQSPEAKCYISPKQRPSWDKYVRFTEDFCNVYNYDPDLFVINVQKSAVTPLLNYSKDSEVYINTCRQIASTLTHKKSVTHKLVEVFMGITPKAPDLKKTVDVAVPRVVMTKGSDLTARNQGLVNSLETPILNGLRKIMERDGLDNEYAALARAVANEVKRGSKK